MLNFFISIVVFAVSTFLLALSIRYGILFASRVDSWLLSKSGSSFEGFDWYFRIPFSVGAIPEYFYSMVLGKIKYFNTNWWALRTSSFLSILLFIALLKSKTGVTDYYSLLFLGDKGIMAFVTSGLFVWYLNFVTLAYLTLSILITIESVKMARIYSPVRVLIYGLLSVFMAGLTLAVLSILILISVIYLAYKVIMFLFFNKNRKQQKENGDENAGDIFKRGFSGFKPDLYEWESNRRTNGRRKKENLKPIRKPIILRRRTAKKKKKETFILNDNIPRIHPE